MKYFLSIPLIAVSIYAQSEGVTLKVSQLLTSAYRYYPSIKLSHEQIKDAQQQIEMASWGYYPTPSVDLSARNGHSLRVARLDQPLWTGGKLTSAEDIAKSKKEEAILSSEEIAYKLSESIFSVLQTYLQSKYSIDALQKGKNKLLELYEMVERRIEAGVSSESDRDLILSRINQMESDIMTHKTKLKIAQMQLENFTGEKIENVLIDNYPLTFLNTFNNTVESLNELTSFHPTLKKMKTMISTASLEVEKTKSSIYPNVSLRAEHQNGAIYDTASTNNQSLVYVTLQATTGAGLSTLSSIEASKIRVKRAEFEMKTKEKELTEDFLNDLNNYYNTKSQIENRKNTIHSSRNVFESYTRLFIAGKRQWLDLVNASKELTQYEVEIASMQGYKEMLEYKLLLKLGKIDLKSGALQ